MAALSSVEERSKYQEVRDWPDVVPRFCEKQLLERPLLRIRVAFIHLPEYVCVCGCICVCVCVCACVCACGVCVCACGVCVCSVCSVCVCVCLSVCVCV